MQKIGVQNKTVENYGTHHHCFEQYSSVEITNAHKYFCYHFKLWRFDDSNMCILVKEDSQILSKLKEGDCLNMKYYGSEALSDSECRETTIQMIRKADNGKFKGHYLVYLDILN